MAYCALKMHRELLISPFYLLLRDFSAFFITTTTDLKIQNIATSSQPVITRSQRDENPTCEKGTLLSRFSGMFSLYLQCGMFFDVLVAFAAKTATGRGSFQRRPLRLSLLCYMFWNSSSLLSTITSRTLRTLSLQGYL